MNRNVKILVACHKEDPNIRKDDLYLPVQVGKSLHPEVELAMQGDNTGDNISDKNESYCELTALYWGWKNLKDYDLLGLAHYRRYLEIDEKIINKVNDKTVVLPYPSYTPYSNLVHLTDGTTREDVYIFLKTLESKHPEYLESAINYLYNNNGWVGCNMFLATNNVVNNYCTWLFSILESLEQKIKISPYSRLKRIYGYLGEILLPIYCKTNNLNIIYVRMSSHERRNVVKYNIHRLLNIIAFKLTHFRKTKELAIPSSTMVSLRNDRIL